MNIDLHGKSAFICGGSKGIGKATAEILASLGASVTIAAREERFLKETIRSLTSPKGVQHHYVVLDLSNHISLEETIKQYLTHQPHIHILVNNAGGPPAGEIIHAEKEDFEKAFAMHVLGAHKLSGMFIPGMKKEKYGRIVNIISTSVKAPLKGLGVSNTIRGAMANWAKTLSNEVAAYGITVNNVLPGATKTGRLDEIISKKANTSEKSISEIEAMMKHQIPMQRFAAPKEVAAAVAFLSSPAAAYITGINLPVDGGRTPCL